MHHRPHCAAERLEARSYLAGDLGFAFAVGSSGHDKVTDVALDPQGNVVIAGHFNKTVDFDPSSASQTKSSKGDFDCFVAKYTPAGALMWVKSFGGSGKDELEGLTVDSSGNVLATGFFRSSVDFDPGSATHSLSSSGGADGFILKLDSAGSFKWVEKIGGSSDSGGTNICTDRDGNVYSAGMFSGSIDINPGSATKTLKSAGAYDVFVSKLSSSGSYIFGKRLGGSGVDYMNGMAIGADEHVHLAGSFEGTVDFDPNDGTASLKSAGSSDVYIAELTSGGSFISARRAGGASADEAGDLAVDSSGSVYVTGNFKGAADFDPGSATATLTSAGDSDAFVLKLDSSANYQWAKRIGGSKRDRGTDIALDASANIYLTGHFAGSVDFDPGSDVQTLSSSGGTSDAFVAKFSSGGAFNWARRAGGAGDLDVGEAIVVNAGKNIYTIGVFNQSGDFDPASGSKTLTSKGEEDGFLLMLLA